MDVILKCLDTQFRMENAYISNQEPDNCWHWQSILRYYFGCLGIIRLISPFTPPIAILPSNG